MTDRTTSRLITIFRTLGERRALRISACLLIGLALSSVWGWQDARTYLYERRALSAIAQSLAPGDGTVTVRARALEAAVQQQVASTSKGRRYNKRARPALRHSAYDTWTMQEGRCGEGARLLVNLLQLSGIPAARVNLSEASKKLYHTAVVFYDNNDWWLIDSINSSPEFRTWSRQNRLPLSKLFVTKLDYGGALLIESQVPQFDRYSFGSWSRIVGPWFEVNQFVPLPQWLVHLLENPHLLALVLKVAVSGLLALMLWILSEIAIWFQLVRPQRFARSKGEGQP